MPYDLTPCTNTRQLSLAYASNYEERATLASGTIATEDLENHGYTLLELDETLEQALINENASNQSSPALVIRGLPKDEAVLCTSSSTFALRRVEWSNALLVVDTAPTTISNTNDDAMDVVADQRPAIIQATLAHLLEAQRIQPNIARLPELMYRQKLYGMTAALTFDELRPQVQASDHELMTGLTHYDIVQLEDGGYRQITSEHICHVLASIFTTFAMEDIRLEDRIPVNLRQLDTNNVSDQAMLTDATAHDDIPHVFVDSKCVDILDMNYFDNINIHYEQNEFMQAWSESVPEGYTVSLDMLQGICIAEETDDTATSTMVRTLVYLPVDQLPRDPAARLRMLFDTRAKWRSDELRVYLQDIAITPTQIDTWLMKFARRVTGNGAMARNQKRKANGDAAEQVWYCARIDAIQYGYDIDDYSTSYRQWATQFVSRRYSTQQNTTTTTTTHSLSPETLVLRDKLIHGERYALSRAITLVESSRYDHRIEASRLLSSLLEKKHNDKHTFRIGLSGPPGVGKSTFIEQFGKLLLNEGHRVSVLAIDPSSSRTGGSILGDKTRMPMLSRDERAYIRPSPTSGSLGGVARNTAEAMMLCEVAGFDICLVETVGVGQSETTVAEMVDMFCLFVPPGGGDELQGMKKGVVELADLIIVTKADGDLLPAARIAQQEYTSALKFVQPRFPEWRPQVIKASSKNEDDIKHVWDKMSEYRDTIIDTARLEEIRSMQRTRWMWHQVSSNLLQMLKDDDLVQNQAKSLEPLVSSGKMAWGDAAEQLVQAFLTQKKNI
ncbi:ArgK protein-domain-containing protein [Syncephalis plumigaleata]|nr:ArgK protein-domain-containing protein [Syncephalis plumigaleata]